MCLLLKVKRPVLMRSMKKVFTKNSVASDRSGQPEITPSVIEARNLSENTCVEQTHDGSGQLDERNCSTAHTVKEQHAHEVHREIASFNTDNEFNRKINEEDIDFSIPGLPHYTVKQLHSASVRELIQKMENHPVDISHPYFNLVEPACSHILVSSRTSFCTCSLHQCIRIGSRSP